MKSVYSAVRTGALNKAVCASSLKGYIIMDFCVLVFMCDFFLMTQHAYTDLDRPVVEVL
jgi:hypothetical protein